MISVVIVAAGRGTRMGPGVDKLFLEVRGRAVVAHTWLLFDRLAEVDEVVVVVRSGLETDFEDLARTMSVTKPYRIVAGGEQRQDSVWNGLQALDAKAEVVAIHDGARPCTAVSVIRATLEAAARVGAAVAAQRVTDTIKEEDGGGKIVRTVPRKRLWSVQTPQAFRVSVIRRALQEVRDRQLSVTDDTAACELTGQLVELVEGREPNPKVTVPADLAYVGLLLADRGR